MRACQAFAAGDPAALPKRSPKKARPVRRGVAFWAVRDDGTVLLRRRPEKGLLGGMMEVPSTPWEERRWVQSEALVHAPVAAEWRAIDGTVQHTFTHFHLELTVLAADTGKEECPDGQWVPLGQLNGQALPTVMKKVVKLARGLAG
jgi:A/G-specific adenine glycosylase